MKIFATEAHNLMIGDKFTTGRDSRQVEVVYAVNRTGETMFVAIDPAKTKHLAVFMYRTVYLQVGK